MRRRADHQKKAHPFTTLHAHTHTNKNRMIFALWLLLIGDDPLTPAIYQNIYSSSPRSTPWSIGGPQPTILELAKSGALINKRVLDCGCGTGENANSIITVGGALSIMGFDISDAAIEIARETVPAASSATFVACSSSETINKLASHTFDVAVDSALLHCLNDEDARQHVHNVHALLAKPSGKFYIGCFSDENASPWSNPRRLSQSYLKQLLDPQFTISSIERKWWARPDARGSNCGSYSLAWWCEAVAK